MNFLKKLFPNHSSSPLSQTEIEQKVNACRQRLSRRQDEQVRACAGPSGRGFPAGYGPPWARVMSDGEIERQVEGLRRKLVGRNERMEREREEQGKGKGGR